MAWVMPSVMVAFACTSVTARALAAADATAKDPRLKSAMVSAGIEKTEAVLQHEGMVGLLADKQSVYGYRNRLWWESRGVRAVAEAAAGSEVATALADAAAAAPAVSGLLLPEAPALRLYIVGSMLEDDMVPNTGSLQLNQACQGDMHSVGEVLTCGCCCRGRARAGG